MIVVTGGAGFIGSAIAQELNTRERADLIIVDDIDHPEKEKNIASIKYQELIGKNSFLGKILDRDIKSIEVIIHMGACSSTTETDENFLTKNNYHYTRHLATCALEKSIRFIYASSAATYGNGEMGYSDDESKLKTLKPLNFYGESKHKFDLWAESQGILDRVVGLKYFNIFGPNEYHKGAMKSVVAQKYDAAKLGKPITLFKSYRPDCEDGEQQRDFIYVRDCADVMLWLLDNPDVNGLFNLGTGRARSFMDLADALSSATGKARHVEYIDMPSSIRERYQYFTEAAMSRLRAAGFVKPFTSLEAGVADYVKNFLATNDPYL